MMEAEDSVAENRLVSKVTGPIHDRTESSVMNTPTLQGICAVGDDATSVPCVVGTSQGVEHHRLFIQNTVFFDGNQEQPSECRTCTTPT